MAQQTDKFSVQVGDPDRVSLRMSLFPDPQPAPTGEPEIDASWGEVVLWVNGRNLTTNRVWGDEHEGIQWYLLPLLEWLVENWSPLLHEERPAGLTEVDDAAHALLGRRMPRALSLEEAASWFEQKQDWLLRHDVASAAEGGRFPTLLIRRLRGDIEFSWSNDEGSAEFGFTERSGRAVADGYEVAHVFHDAVAAAAEALSRIAPDCGRYRQLAEAISVLREPARADERMAWLAGLGASKAEVVSRWYALANASLAATEGASKAARRALLGLNREADSLYVGGSCRVGLLFGSLAPTISVADARTIARQLVDSYGKQSPGRLEDLGDLRPTPGRPWGEGYELADRVHHELGTDVRAPIRINEILDGLGTTYRNASLSDPDARAFCFASPEHRPTIVVNKNFTTNRFIAVWRTTLAHEFCHLLFDRDEGRELAVASGPWAPLPIEQRANAFAAMFLMPETLVQRSIAEATEPPTTIVGVRQIAKKMRTSTHTTIEHLHNLNQIDLVVRDRLLEELSRSSI